MVHRYYDLPSLTALAVFEASVRHLSFKLAASELNVTPSAVSRQIKAIEDELGVPLFVRLGSGMLTSAGEDLYAVLASSFSKASHVARTLKRGDRSKNVTIAPASARRTARPMLRPTRCNSSCPRPGCVPRRSRPGMLAAASPMLSPTTQATGDAACGVVA
ncbi:LysR family transcriptional regulator [Mesorhizobium shangrilense]|uniref:LysR family transcriptional regulator n=1 Tax=Mesorhizobium shangrilense TaxID=460060 RepID=A0ABV2DR64_9HYPH